jgi:AraC family transcriptional regulator of adaptative response / DNA-3-methyladenine glycosylase II
MPAARARTVVGLAAALASGAVGLDAGADWEDAGARLVALPGIGPWTAGYIRMRALADPDVFLVGDVALVRAVRQLGGDGAAGKASGGLAAVAGRWRPWRSYAVHHLWATLEPGAGQDAGQSAEPG